MRENENAVFGERALRVLRTQGTSTVFIGGGGGGDRSRLMS